MKRVSVAEAKNTLPALLHKPVAVILSRANYDRLRGKGEGVWTAIERFRSTHDLAELDAASALDGLRDAKTDGRPVRW
jgi:predicted alpha/beta hydrolase